jgi:hypothetical protein
VVERNYMPDIASLDTGFPVGMPAPALLRDFAHWLAQQARSSLGWFHFASEVLPASYVHDDHAAELLRERLGCFMRLADGSLLALWARPDRAPAVVQLGANRQVSEVAPSLESFLLALTRAATGIRDLDRERSLTRAGLADWLAARGISEGDPGQDVADRESFSQWFAATVAAAGSSARKPALLSPPLPHDLFVAIDPLLGRLADDPQLIEFFRAIGVELGALRDPAALRCIPRSADGVSFELAWPWDYPSHWLEQAYPRPARRDLEQRRARMLWSVSFALVAENKRGPTADQIAFAPYTGALPFGLAADGGLERVEELLGQPTRGRMGTRVWDDLRPQRTLTVLVNEGPFQRADLATGTLRELTWRVSQS